MFTQNNRLKVTQFGSSVKNITKYLFYKNIKVGLLHRYFYFRNQIKTFLQKGRNSNGVLKDVTRRGTVEFVYVWQ